MPWHGGPTKGAGSRDSPGGAALRRRSRGARMGEPSRRGPATRICGGQPGELKHLSTPRRGNQDETPRVAASERGPAQTGACVQRARVAAPGLRARVAGGRAPPAGVTKRRASGSAWEGAPQRVRAPYAEPAASRPAAPSTAGHVKPGGKQGGPPSKAEHLPVTDSGRVPGGKGEKHPGRGVKQTLKPCAPEQPEHTGCVTACLLKNEPASRGRRRG